MTMIRGLLLVLALLYTPHAWAATVYIDPSCTNSGDGTTTTCGAALGTGPFKTWAAVTWTAGNTYSGKGGTTAAESVTVGASGTSGNLITLTSYGTGQHTITGSGTSAIIAADRSYLTVTNLAFSTAAGNGIDIQSTGAVSNLTFTDNTFSTIKTNGIKVGDANNGSVITDVTITGNTFTSIGSSAILYPQLPAGNAGVWARQTISDNYFTTVGRDVGRSVIDMLMLDGTTAQYTDVFIQRNTIENCNNDYLSNPSTIRLVRSPSGVAIQNRFNRLTITDNSITTTRAGAIDVSDVGGVSLIARNGSDNLDGNAAIAVFWSSGVVIEFNRISNIRPLSESSYIDGMGLDLENNTSLIVRHNRVSGNLGHTGVNNSGQGIYNFACSACSVYSNLLVGNKNGFHVYGAATTPSEYRNNTVINSTRDGFWVSWSAASRSNLTNNLISGSGNYGIEDEGSGGTLSVLTTNLVYGSTVGNYSNTPGGTDLTSNPLLTPVYRLGPGSPARAAGTGWLGCTDLFGRACPPTPNIGAYQPMGGDPRP